LNGFFCNLIWFATAEEIVAKTSEVYTQIYHEDLIKELKDAIGPYNNQKNLIDYLLTKAKLKKQ
jgi:hypothetical protein